MKQSEVQKIMDELGEKNKHLKAEPYTNYDKIMDMDIDELTNFLNNSLEHCHQICDSSTCAFHRECKSGIKKWLLSEA